MRPVQALRRAFPMPAATLRVLAVTTPLGLIGLGIDVAVLAAGVRRTWAFWPLAGLTVAGLAVTAWVLLRVRQEARRERK